MEKDPITRWLERYTGEDVKRRCLSILEKFSSFAKKNPQILLQDALEDIASKRYPARAEDLLNSFYQECLTRGLAATSALSMYTTIRSFYAANYIHLGRIPKQFTVDGAAYESSRILTQEEVRAMLENAPAPVARNRAIIAFLAQTGQREGILTAMKWSFIKPCEDFGLVEVPPEFLDPEGENTNKARVRYRFVIDSDSMKLINELPKEDWLFQVSNRQIRRIVATAAFKAGIQKELPTKLGKRYEVHCHSFRRFWRHQMRKAGVTDVLLLDFMMGHRLPYHGTYDRFLDEDLLDAYRRAEPYLRILR